MNPFAAYQSLIQTWVNTVEHAQANMLAFHQAVSSIQGYRARALGQWWQQAPQHISNILQSPTPGDAMANLTLWQGQTVLAANTLNNDTNAVRAHLVKVWSRTFAQTPQATGITTQAKTSVSTASITPPTPVSTPKASTPKPVTAKAPEPEPTPIAATEAPPAPKPVKVAETKPVETTSTPTAQTSQPTAQVVQLPTPQPAPQLQPSVENVQLASGSDVTITPTATSFARNTGHALNASAAPRRTASIPLRRSARR